MQRGKANVFFFLSSKFKNVENWIFYLYKNGFVERKGSWHQYRQPWRKQDSLCSTLTGRAWGKTRPFHLSCCTPPPPPPPLESRGDLLGGSRMKQDPGNQGTRVVWGGGRKMIWGDSWIKVESAVTRWVFTIDKGSMLPKTKPVGFHPHWSVTSLLNVLKSRGASHCPMRAFSP